MQDRRLLRQFVQHDSQAAFAEIVRRYLKLVYSTCLREIGDRQIAEDVTQAVFLILAQKAPSLGRHTSLAGWLFHTARLTSKSAVRREQRRRRREHMAAQLLDATQSAAEQPKADLSLNEALASLRPREREAVLLRFFEEMNFKEVGETLGLSEDTAQKRVSRALERMRAHMARQRATLSQAALIGVLTAEAAHTVPSSCASPLLQIVPGLKISIDAGSLFGTKAYHISQGVLRTMKAKAMMTAASVSTLVVGAVSMLMAGGGGGSNNIIGTWASQVPVSQHKTASMTIHFKPDNTFTSTEWYKDAGTHKPHTLIASGTYKLTTYHTRATSTDTSLTTTVTQVIANGKPEPLTSAGLPTKTGVTAFSEGGKTLTLNYSYFKQVMKRQ